MGEQIKYKIAIVLDEEKIKKLDEYYPDDIYDEIEYKFSHYGIIRLKSEYTGKGKLLVYGCGNDKYGHFWFIVMNLLEKEWFKPYLVKYIYYSQSNYSNSNWRSENVLSILENFKIKQLTN